MSTRSSRTVPSSCLQTLPRRNDVESSRSGIVRNSLQRLDRGHIYCRCLKMPSDLGAEIFGADYSEKESVITDKEANFVSESHCEPRNSVLYLASISSVGKKKAPKFKREVSGVFGVCFSCSAGSH